MNRLNTHLCHPAHNASPLFLRSSWLPIKGEAPVQLTAQRRLHERFASRGFAASPCINILILLMIAIKQAIMTISINNLGLCCSWRLATDSYFQPPPITYVSRFRYAYAIIVSRELVLSDLMALLGKICALKASITIEDKYFVVSFLIYNDAPSHTFLHITYKYIFESFRGIKIVLR